MIAAVNPIGNGFGGGVLATAGRPTAVGGGSFASPGTAAGTPPGVQSSNIIEARNNKGSNVQVPYARLVPMHSRENVQAAALEVRGGNANVRDKRLLMVHGAPQLEYDGLHQGELAWILGRRFKSAVNPNQGGGDDGISEFTDMERYAHQAFAGLGSGVDRMQRLASTGWVESLFEERIGRASIKLHKIRLDTPYAKAMDSNAKHFANYLGGSSILNCPDITWWRAILEEKLTNHSDVGNYANHVNEGKRAQGINLVDTSPFLRGTQVDSKVVRFEGKAVPGATVPEDIARNQGDIVSISVLETELRRRNIMDWTPDGIVLSKLESPTDEPMKSTEMDARQAQLFNVGVQGPSITKSWTKDVKNFRLEVQPMDKVFIVVVATLSYRVNDIGDAEYEVLRAAQLRVLLALYTHRKLIEERKPQDEIDAANDAITQALIAAKTAGDNLESALDGADEPKYDTLVDARNTEQAMLESAIKANESTNIITQLQNRLKTAQADIDAMWRMPDKDEVDLIRSKSKLLRQNEKSVSKANLTNFRLVRETSSHMSNYSYYKPGDENSRLGLKMGPVDGVSDDFCQVRDVIVGGWCIGTVIDSAASRSTIGFQTLKSHPTSMAININVNVQWWSGDKLYKHYHDAGGLVMMRGLKRDLDNAGVSIPQLDEDMDVVPDIANAGKALFPTIGEDLSGAPDHGPVIPPMANTRRVLSRTAPAVASGSGSAAASAFPVPASGASGAASARPGGSRRA